MKILLINNLFPPYSRGGAERIVELMAAELKNLGHEIAVITTKPYRDGQGFEISQNGTSVYRLSSRYLDLSHWPLVLRPLWHLYNAFDFSKANAINQIIKNLRPDLVIAHNLLGIGGLTAASLRNHKIPYVQILHDIQLLHPSGLMFFGKENILDSLSAKLYQKLNRCLFKNPDLVISPSTWLLNLHEHYGFFKKSKKLVLPNPSAVISEATRRDDGKTVLFIGQIDEYKGILTLLEAWKSVGDPQAKLILAGDGRLYEQLKSDNQDARISYLGRQSREQINTLLASSSLLVVPSLCYENSPTVIYEAATYGLPVIASDIGGIPELVGRLGGQLFPAGDATALADKINDFLSADQERKKHFATRIINTENNYSEEVLKNIQ
jgi:glycosyltransferase involved in cell wall biosynthesis